MKMPRILSAVVLGLALSAGTVSADPVLEIGGGTWTITYYYTNDAVPVHTGTHYSPCEGFPYWEGNPGPVEVTYSGPCE